jgi:hypothetical protein
VALPRTQKRNLRRILRGFGAANGTTTVPGAAGKALEAWIFMRLAMSARATGLWRATLRRGDGTILPPGADFAFATSQSGIRSASLQAPCYVLLEHRSDPYKRLELHGSLQWQGRSQATHEIDVSAIPANVAEALRRGSGGLPRGLPVVAVECKDKDGTGGPDEMRQTLARMFDLVLVTSPPNPIPQCRIYEPNTRTAWGNKSFSYRGFFALGTFAIARAGKFSDGARKLGSHYYILQSGDIYEKTELEINILETNFIVTLSNLGNF